MIRSVPLALGLLTLFSVWLAPVGRLVPAAFSAHMTVHMGVVAVAAPLIAFGVAGGKLDHVRRAPALFPAIPASIVELLVVWAWHTPALHHAARHSIAASVIEQGTFLLSGLFVWLAAFGGRARDRGDRGATGVVALLLTSMHMTLLGALLALSPRALYAHAVADQHWGGAIMLVVGGISYLAGGLWLTSELLGKRRARPSLLRSQGSSAGAGS